MAFSRQRSTKLTTKMTQRKRRMRSEDCQMGGSNRRPEPFERDESAVGDVDAGVVSGSAPLVTSTRFLDDDWMRLKTQ